MQDTRDFWAAGRDGARAGQAYLRQAPHLLEGLTPPWMHVKASGGVGNPTPTPWLAFFDPDETTTAQAGIYVVYLFDAEQGQVFLTLNQGVTAFMKRFGRAPRVREELAREAELFRTELQSGGYVVPDDVVDLRSKGRLQRYYESGTISSRAYTLHSLPNEAALSADLNTFLDLYAAALEVKRNLRLTGRGDITTPHTVVAPVAHMRQQAFKPKDSADYVSHIRGQRLLKGRKHEDLVKNFGLFAMEQGFAPSTEHPIDLMLRRHSDEWLVEAKMVYNGDVTTAVRDAIGQLLTYDHLLFRGRGLRPPALVALFSEDVGEAFVELLERFSIRTVWHTRTGWRGSPTAYDDQLIGGGKPTLMAAESPAVYRVD